ncbi:hypothetical protein CTI12_AA098920 [Artemisia annua]|uniref:Uncharacterized protein n=1 Tax=Artemisia annua TaxID=35608 RepID=A0A2U1N9Y7_ARTAN|nr:hypothetical protein CTI12_AA098920 [Artemisia annua]
MDRKQPGKKVLCMSTTGIDRSSCQFVEWFDLPICARATVIIPDLLRSRIKIKKALQHAQVDIFAVKANVSKWKLYLMLFVVWVFMM